MSLNPTNMEDTTWEERFDEEFGQMECSDKTYISIKDFIRKELQLAQERGERKGREEAVEPVAMAIYDQVLYTEGGVKPGWVVGGNSIKQDEARKLARKALTPHKGEETNV